MLSGVHASECFLATPELARCSYLAKIPVVVLIANVAVHSVCIEGCRLVGGRITQLWLCELCRIPSTGGE